MEMIIWPVEVPMRKGEKIGIHRKEVSVTVSVADDDFIGVRLAGFRLGGRRKLDGQRNHK